MCEKTKEEWIKLLKTTIYYKKWLNNRKPGYFLDRVTNPMGWYSFIFYSFFWEETPEGYDFWRNLAKNQPNFKESIYYV